ncbi:DUF4197 domain-containing protein [Curvibacter sp. PAE-UM]|uniref:DUF4197 domain-containing protein n=1 Tax=Curvibacter sp. PAE-UM TaxID=1714344 RepID=UPI00070D4B2D|nr:DUF4197 domain-containing protein [Curvibacter sp. PAE-UM]KRH99403.1 hypothetical protein AO057_02435 [Curvibacter sp. PAE-UM]
MDRRKFNSIGWLALPGVPLLTLGPAQALTLEELSQSEAVRALKAALERGARSAIGQLGQLNGFLGNEKVRIPLPRQLQDAEQMLRTFGQGGRLDELVTTMNRAAEAAVPMAQELMLGAVRGMTVADGKKILGGGETSVTTFFADKTRLPLGQKFLPVVTRSTEKVGLAGQYNHIASKAADFGLLRREDASIEQYVTGKALDGLYYVIGEEERKIRRDPVATGSALLSKVFGALK